jgi:hypothetical protein
MLGAFISAVLHLSGGPFILLVCIQLLQELHRKGISPTAPRTIAMRPAHH